jgi:hypothetical protein
LKYEFASTFSCLSSLPLDFSSVPLFPCCSLFQGFTPTVTRPGFTRLQVNTRNLKEIDEASSSPRPLDEQDIEMAMPGSDEDSNMQFVAVQPIDRGFVIYYLLYYSFYFIQCCFFCQPTGFFFIIISTALKMVLYHPKLTKTRKDSPQVAVKIHVHLLGALLPTCMPA